MSKQEQTVKKNHFVYVIKHKETNCFYIGLDSTVNEESRILNSYFTSSSLVKAIIKADGKDSFVVDRIIKCKNQHHAKMVEIAVIYDNNPSGNQFALNRSFYRKGQRVNIPWPVADYKGNQININPHSVLIGATPIGSSSSNVVYNKDSLAYKKFSKKSKNN